MPMPGAPAAIRQLAFLYGSLSPRSPPPSPHPASATVTDDLLLRYTPYLGQGTYEVSDSPLWFLRLIEGSGDSPMCLKLCPESRVQGGSSTA